MRRSKSSWGPWSKFPPQGKALGFQVAVHTQSIRGREGNAGDLSTAGAVANFYPMGKVLSSARMRAEGGANEANQNATFGIARSECHLLAWVLEAGKAE